MAHEVPFTAVGALPCCCCTGATTGTNVIGITKEEYDAYKKGGTWTIVCSITANESYHDSDTDYGSTSGSFYETITFHTSGCLQEMSHNWATWTVTYYNPSGSYSETYTVYMYLMVNLGQDGDSYFMEISAYWADVTSGDGTSTGHPSSESISVDGNALVVFGTWTPGWVGKTGYSENNATTMTATFAADT